MLSLPLAPVLPPELSGRLLTRCRREAGEGWCGEESGARLRSARRGDGGQPTKWRPGAETDRSTLPPQRRSARPIEGHILYHVTGRRGTTTPIAPRGSGASFFPVPCPLSRRPPAAPREGRVGERVAAPSRRCYAGCCCPQVHHVRPPQEPL